MPTVEAAAWLKTILALVLFDQTQGCGAGIGHLALGVVVDDFEHVWLAVDHDAACALITAAPSTNP
jgi:hypothetical protein